MDDWKARRQAIEAQRRAQAVEDRLNASGIPKRHRSKDLKALLKHSQFAQTLQKACKIADAGGIVAFLGAGQGGPYYGNGKTQLSVELIRRVCKRGQDALYCRAVEIGMVLRAAYREAGMTEHEALERFVEPHLLVIDECQERPGTDFEVGRFRLLLDRRYGDEKPTVLVANTDETAFRSLVGHAVFDRIREGGGALVFDWPSFRV